MQKTSYLLIAALVAGGLAATLPVVGAIDVGCQRAEDTPTGGILVPPGGLVTNWTPDCLIVSNGDTITWTNGDAIAHGAIKPGCFDLGRVALGASQTLTIELEGSELFTLENGEESECEDFEIGDDSITLVYRCVIHGAAMTGRIIVEL